MDSFRSLLRARRARPGAIALLLIALAGVGLTASGCGLLPRLLPVQAGQRTATPSPTSSVIGAPGAAISPSEGGAGTRITVQGHNWTPGDTVFVRLEDPETGRMPGLDQASAIVTDRGDFAVRFTYPFDPRWLSIRRVSIVVLDPANGQRVVVQFTVLGAIEQPTAQATVVAGTATPVETQQAPTAAPPTLAPTSQSPFFTPVPPATATPRPIASPTATYIAVTFVPPTRVPPTVTPVPPPVITDWRGEYYNNPDLAGSPATVRNDWAVDFNWGLGSPAANVPVENFSARWTRTVNFGAGTYRFFLSMDDGARFWIDGQLIIDQWFDGSAREIVADYPLNGGPHSLRMEYYERTGQARAGLRWQQLGPISYPDWKGEYWANLSFAGTPLVSRNDRIIDFNWGVGAPAAGLPADGFTVRWTRSVVFSAGLYRFFAQSDDGMRMYVDGRLVLDNWRDQTGDVPHTADVRLGGTHVLTVEYYERTGGALARLWWQQIFLPPTLTPTSVPPTSTPTRPPSATPTRTVSPTATPTRTPSATLSPTAIPSLTPTATATETPVTANTYTPTPGPSATPTHTPTLTATWTTTPTDVPTFTPTATVTPGPTATPTETPKPTETPTTTPEPTETPTETPKPTETPTETPEPTETPTETPEPTETPTETPEPTETPTQTPLPTDTPTLEPDATLPTSTPSPTPSPTLVASTVRLNEVLSNPERVNWDRRGRIDRNDQWVELYNAGRRPVDMQGWSLEVLAGRNTQAARFGRRSTIPASDYLVLYGRQTGLVLDPKGGEIRLRDQNGRLVDTVKYPALDPDASYSRSLGVRWAETLEPSPGDANEVVEGTPTPTPTPTQ